jgi:hypothetical protein
MTIRKSVKAEYTTKKILPSRTQRPLAKDGLISPFFMFFPIMNREKKIRMAGNKNPNCKHNAI